MARIKYADFAVNSDGTTLSSAQVEVRDKGGNLVTLYAAETGSTEAYSGANPFLAGDGDPDKVGFFEFWYEEEPIDITVGTGASANTYPVKASGLVQYSTRALLVTAVAAGLVWPDGTIISDGTVEYVASAGATGISDLGGLTPFGNVTVKHFGAVGDGVTNDQAAVTEALTYTQNGTLYLKDGDYNLSTPAAGNNTQTVIIENGATLPGSSIVSVKSLERFRGVTKEYASTGLADTFETSGILGRTTNTGTAGGYGHRFNTAYTGTHTSGFAIGLGSVVDIDGDLQGRQACAYWGFSNTPQGTANSWGVFGAELNVVNLGADTGWGARRSALSNWTAALQLVPESSDLSGSSGATTYNGSFGLVIAPSAAVNDKNDGKVASFYTGICVERNAVAPTTGVGIHTAGATASGDAPRAAWYASENFIQGIDLSGATFTTGPDIELSNGGEISSPAAQTVAITTSSTERFRISSTGLVGIGTNSPAYLLDLNESRAQARIRGDIAGLEIDRTGAGNEAFISFKQSGGAEAQIRSDASGDLFVRTSATERVRIDSTGQVGIGTQTPAYLLDVNRSGAQARVRGDTAGLIIDRLSGNEPFVEFQQAGVKQAEIRGSSGVMILRNNGIETLRLEATGRLGGTAVQSDSTDTTAERLLRVGAFGLGNSSSPPDAPGDDIDDQNAPLGFFKTDNATLGTFPDGVTPFGAGINFRRATDDQKQFYAPAGNLAGGNNVYFRSYDTGTSAWFDWQRLVAEDANGFTQLNGAGYIGSEEIVIADDAVATFTPPRNGGYVFLTTNSGITSPNSGTRAFLWFDVGVTPEIVNVSAGSLVDTSNSLALTGTAGTDGRYTVSVQPADGTFDVENRAGFAATVTAHYIG